MSEPDGAFIKLQIDRPELVRWLDHPPPATSRWTDWRAIGGQWYFKDGVQDIARISDRELADNLADSNGRLTKVATNRTALREMIGYAKEAPWKRASYAADTKEFIAGTLTFSENLIEIMGFLTVARGAADFLGDGRHGIVVIHNYIFGSEEARVTEAALRLGPHGTSSFLAAAEKASAAGAFESLARGMIDPPPAKWPPPVDQLDELR